MEIDIHTAMLNSYRVIIQGLLPEDIISTELGMFAHDPTEPVEKEVIENMLFYFEEEEEYEKCIKIRNYIKEKW